MMLVLDSGGVTALAGQRARLAELRSRGLWPPVVPAIVLTECLRGDHRADFHANRLLSMCNVHDVDEPLARHAARLRTRTARAGEISATDAIVAAHAIGLGASSILTSDPDDLQRLVDAGDGAVRVIPA